MTGDRLTSTDLAEFTRMENFGARLEARLDFGVVEIRSITAYRNVDFTRAFDGDSTDMVFFHFSPQANYSDQFSQEVLLSNSADSRFSWVAGANFMQESEDFDTVQRRNFFGTERIGDAQTVTNGESYAVFGDATYSLTEKLSITGGLRFTQDERFTDTIFDLDGMNVITGLNVGGEWSAFSPRAAINYTLNDEASLYATVTRGFRGGGSTLGSVYNPEFVINYEVGGRLSTRGGRLSLNAAAFYSDYSDLQVRIVDFSNPAFPSGQVTATNAAGADIYGVEGEFNYMPVGWLTLFGNVAYLDAEYVDFITPADIAGDPPVDASGNQLIGAPEWSSTVGVELRRSIGSWGELAFRVQHAYRSRIFISAATQDSRYDLDPYSRTNIRLSFVDAADRFEVAAFVDNLTDDLDRTQRIANFAFNLATDTYLPPRTYGATVRYRF